MTLILVSLAFLLLGGLGAALLPRSSRLGPLIGAGGAVAGCAIGLVPAARALLGAPPEAFRLPWGAYGTFHLHLDPLGGFFLLPIFGLSGLAALYGAEYLGAFRGRKRLGAASLFFNVLAASMALVVLARDAILFLVAWEVMALASFFLVTFEDERESVREAGSVYLIATHLGTAFLLALFLVLGVRAGSFDFDAWTGAGAAAPAGAGVLFCLAVAGFGTKAGFLPVHVWLPEAHPAAPSHVSAVMSGVMIKTGIYGLVRILTFLGPPEAWWGWLLVAIGLTSGVLGVLLALAQHDLKRLLAYHSVENIGIIALGLGLGVLGLSRGVPELAVLGFAGGLLHVLNHAVFKGLLFLGAGAVIHATGTREIDHLGGLAKPMPFTAAAFLAGAIAISGLPPFNGFVSELLIYFGAFGASSSHSMGLAIPALATIAGLALIGGLAAACFTKAFGAVFLGEPRGGHAARAHEPGLAMRLPLAALAATCLLIGLLGPLALRALGPMLGTLTRLPPDAVDASLRPAAGYLALGAGGAALLLALAGALALARRRLLAGRPVGTAVTWDCGYARPTARMQYTASSFADPIVLLFRTFLRTRRTVAAPAGYFPRAASLETETPDLYREKLFTPAFGAVRRALAALRWLQHGGVHLYVLYIALTLVVLLVWKLG